MTQIRGAIYALIACVALALALYSCTEPPTQSQSTIQPPTSAIADATPIAAALTPQPPIEPAPTPTAVPDFAPLPEDARFTQIAAGERHVCGLQADGTPLCWGRNVNDSLKIPGGNLTLSQISAGKNFTCGLRIDGAIACWGDNYRGQSSPPDGVFDEIATGEKYACALDDGALICWGNGFPDGAATIQEVPPLSAIQAGVDLACGLTSDNDMACWNNGGEDPANTSDNDDSEFEIISGPFTELAVGLSHVCAIRNDGSVFCEGDHYSRRSSPPPTKFVQISSGLHHACGITETSDIECWGSGVPGATGERLSAPEGKFTAISVGWRNSCALSANGRAVCWQQPDIQNPSELPEAFGGVKFEQPTELFPLPSGDLVVVERNGLIAAYSDEPNAAPPKTLLDLTDETVCCIYETGILSAALHPQFEEFPFLYIYHKVVSKHAHGENVPGFTGRLARFRVVEGADIRDSELAILDVPLPGELHSGGNIRFGADGMLYLGIGDNLSPEKAQSLDTLIGKIIRIDVRGATPEQPYRVPPDNPFVDNPDARPEIWAYGLRNPWRMDFSPDGRLFIADVGYNKYEEISLAEAGANLGWPICEGNLCEEGIDADADGLTAPIFTYGRSDGCAIIGGVTAPRLNNGFVFGDHCSKRVWLLEQDERQGWRARPLAQAEGFIISFGVDADGTMYLLSKHNPIIRLQPEVGEE